MSELDSKCQIPVLGSGYVGKSSILMRYLHGSFSNRYSETVEEMHVQQYSINGKRRYMNFLDTAGNIYFPAMRKIYFSKALGFVLVYSICDARSFEEIKRIWEQIKSIRENVLSIPCVVVGNKLDSENNREVETFDALEWAYSENLGGCFLEVSAKDNNAIKEIFDILLEQLGNTRAKQTTTFRIRSTSFTRKEDRIQKSKHIKNKKMMTFEKVEASSKSFQDTMFEGYKETYIYKVQQKQNKIQKSNSFKDSQPIKTKETVNRREFGHTSSQPNRVAKGKTQGLKKLNKLLSNLFRRQDSSPNNELQENKYKNVLC
ncbi:GTP-binding protein Di-Ras2-like [Mytilus californianus]|uniref:GTP-binding protein Di-Ras2-like n=1 Tax=Mytilus californianus TaxID=6549 RepID=UPI002245BC75|nr:GTP-binding protein Di-Ras2-like [Mytilus californianus]